MAELGEYNPFQRIMYGVGVEIKSDPHGPTEALVVRPPVKPIRSVDTDEVIFLTVAAAGETPE